MIVHCPRRHDTTTRNNTEPTAQDDTTTTNADNSHYVPTNTQPVTTENDNTTSDSDSDPGDVDSNPAEQNDQPTTTTDDGETTETWVEWMRRCTHEAEDQMKTLGIEDWITEHRRHKWRWAQKVATEQLDKWSVKALLWDPTADSRHKATRRRGRPVKRWDDDITKHIHKCTDTQQQTGDDYTTQQLQPAPQTPPQPRQPQSQLPQLLQLQQLPQLPQPPQLPQLPQLQQLPQPTQHNDTANTTATTNAHHNNKETPTNTTNEDNYYARIHWMRLATDRPLWLAMEKEFLTTD